MLAPTAGPPAPLARPWPETADCELNQRLASRAPLATSFGGGSRSRPTSRFSYRKTKQNVTLAFSSNEMGVPIANMGLAYPVWAMVAMALS